MIYHHYGQIQNIYDGVGNFIGVNLIPSYPILSSFHE